MPANLRAIREKIKSFKNTQKITKAMKLVAASKMKKYQDKALYTRDYYLDMLTLMEEILWEDTDHPFFEKREDGETLFILYTSDKGLCGSLNSQLIRNLFKSNKWAKTPPSKRKLMVIGKKGYNYCYYNNIQIDAHFGSLAEEFDTLEALHFVDVIMRFWNERKVKDVYMVVPFYKNSLVNYPIMKQYLPFNKEMLEEHFDFHKEDSGLNRSISEQVINNTTYEPSEKRVFKRVVEHLLEVLFVEAFYELKASEYSSRMIAMQNATDAAQKLIDNTTLELNKARQAKITQEIAELVSGSMFSSD